LLQAQLQTLSIICLYMDTRFTRVAVMLETRLSVTLPKVR